jgi:hypothetical protein
VFELRRFGADALIGEASLQLSSIPQEGRPQYHWLALCQPQDEALSHAGQAGEGAAGCIHIRVQWAQRDEQRGYMAVDVSIQGIGVSIIDSLSAQVFRELTYVHVSDVQV